MRDDFVNGNEPSSSGALPDGCQKPSALANEARQKSQTTQSCIPKGLGTLKALLIRPRERRKRRLHRRNPQNIAGSSEGPVSQTVAGLAFCLALQSYKSKEAAMAAAMSLELGLYSSWKEQMLKEYERLAEMKRGLLKQKNDQALPQGLGTALPVVRKGWIMKMSEAPRPSEQTRKRSFNGKSANVEIAGAPAKFKRTAKAVDTIHENSSEVPKDAAPHARKRGPPKSLVQPSPELHKDLTASKKSQLLTNGLGRLAATKPRAQPQAKGSKRSFANGQMASKANSRSQSLDEASDCARTSSDEAAAAEGHRRKRQKTKEFNTADLKRGMVALIRTVPDNTQEWDRPWSLGRLLKVYPLRKKVDVLWLKPMQGGRPHKNVLWQQWQPWIMATRGRKMEWISEGLTYSSIQYGLPIDKTGRFSDKDLPTLSAEVARLEAAAASGR